MTPRISVVQVVGAQRTRVPEMLARLRAQTLREPFEVIWVDAASELGPLDLGGEGVVPRVLDAGGRSFTEAAAMGMAAAQGPYVAVLEDHAFARSGWLEAVLETFEETSSWNLPVLKNGKYKGFISRSKIFSSYRKLLKEFSDD